VGSARPARDGRLDHWDATVITTRSDIESNLRAFQPAASPSPQRPAAVAVVLLDSAGALAVPIFQRPADMRRHASQMALPGGRVHDGESVLECAMRELHEELGLEVQPTDELGRLDDFDTRSGFTITPVVFWSAARAADLRPSPAEVAVMFLPTTADLIAAAERAGSGDEFSMRLPGVEVFAPTAAMLYQFAEVALRGREVRVADFHQPPWTHR
jgi:8-oxo-dGTP pyrophosphatase MutT (NUDIX family)